MIEHYSAQKFTLDDVVVDCVGNRLKDAMWRNDGKLLEMGLWMPSGVTGEGIRINILVDLY